MKAEDTTDAEIDDEAESVHDKYNTISSHVRLFQNSLCILQNSPAMDRKRK